MSNSTVRLLSLIAVCLAVVIVSGLISVALKIEPLSLFGSSRSEPDPFPFIVEGSDLVLTGLAGCAFQVVLFSIIALISPVRTGRMARALRQPPRLILRIWAIGFLALFAAAILLLLGLYSQAGGAGIPTLLFLLVCTIYLPLSGIALAVGKAVLSRLSILDVRGVSQVSVGTLILYSVSSIPIIGLIMLALLSVLAFGLGLSTGLGNEIGWHPALFSDHPFEE